MNGELEKFIQENRVLFDDQVPGKDVLAQIQKKMGHVPLQQEPDKALVISFRTLRIAAAACIIILAGFAIWWVNEDAAKDENIITANNKSNITTAPPPVENKAITNNAISGFTTVPEKETGIAEQINKENNQQKEILFASLNNMESASTRIAAAMQAYKMNKADKEIVDALLSTMQNDPNTNVRLAALEALVKFHREPYVKKQLTASLKKQKDPLVQVELIQVLTKMKQTGILNELEKLVKDANTNEAVKDRAYNSILTLGS